MEEMIAAEPPKSQETSRAARPNTETDKTVPRVYHEATPASPAARFFQSLLGQRERRDTPGPALAVAPREVAFAKQMERESPPQIPPAGLQQFLADRLGLRLPAVRIHVGPAADRLATLYRADAVSFADRVALRHHRYQPHTAAGAALLGHELTHVAAAANRTGPDSAAAAAREERSALINEHRVLVELAQSRGDVVATAPPPIPAAVLAPAAPLRGAAVDRRLPAAAPAASLNPIQAAQLKDEIYRDLLDRLRTDFERGS